MTEKVKPTPEEAPCFGEYEEQCSAGEPCIYAEACKEYALGEADER